ncbi:hypothetical protein D3C72_2509940 [compost metagenome]
MERLWHGNAGLFHQGLVVPDELEFELERDHVQGAVVEALVVKCAGPVVVVDV